MPRGRPPSAKTLVDRQLGRNVQHPILPAGDGFVVPNHSGDHSEGRVDSDPVNALDLVNKKYVDLAASKNIIQLFLTGDASADIASYFDLDSSPDTGAEQEITTSIAGTNLNIEHSEFVSVLSDATVSAIEVIEEGIYNCHVHASGTSNKNLFLCCVFYKRNSGGTETEIGTTEEIELSTSKSSVDMHLNITDSVAWTSTDRMVMKAFVRNANPTSKDVSMFAKGDTYSRVEFPAFAPVSSHDAVTVSGTPDYITLVGQDIVRGTVDISDDTNLTVSSPITLTADDVGLDLTTTYDWSGVHEFQTNTKLQFRDTGIFIHSNSDGELTVQADTKVTIGVAGDIVLGDSTERTMKPQTDVKMNLGDSTHTFAKIFTTLPTSDPSVTGQLWNNSGVVNVSA